jgi:mannan polymerase II complex ANP1 subunit
MAQMAKRMQYSVVGLPHYVIWHLYEPSVDDIRHMEVSKSILFVVGRRRLT